jgi:hypothetical protein
MFLLQAVCKWVRCAVKALVLIENDLSKNFNCQLMFGLNCVIITRPIVDRRNHLGVINTADGAQPDKVSKLVEGCYTCPW